MMLTASMLIEDCEASIFFTYENIKIILIILKSLSTPKNYLQKGGTGLNSIDHRCLTLYNA